MTRYRLAKYFLSLQTQIETLLDSDNKKTVKTIRKWNNQVQWLLDKNGAKVQLFRMPAVFIAFKTGDIMQLGNGVQMYDPLIFELHILNWQLDAKDGTLEQDLNVFNLKDDIYLKVQKFQPGLTDETIPAGAAIRFSEQEDNEHPGVYHFIQSYRCQFLDSSREEPFGGVDGPAPPLPLQLDVLTKAKQDAATAYNPLVQYLAADEPYVRYLDIIYVCIADTPNPAGAFDGSKWQLIEPTTYNFTPS